MKKNQNHLEFRKNTQKIDEKLVRTAYLALKRAVYYDKSNTNITLRKRIIDFEADKDLGKVFKELYEKIKLSDKEYFKKLYKKIKLIRTPKTLYEIDEEKNFVTNNTKFSKYTIQRYFIFIDCPIELHLVTILWIYKIGVYIDKELPNSIYGNRLNYDYENKQLNDLSLFKPYYQQYSQWRDDAVKVARFITEEQKKDSAILTMDIKDFYYSISIDKDELKDYLESSICGIEFSFIASNEEIRFIHSVFEEIHKAYTAKFIKKNYPKENNIIDIDLKLKFSLPIGLFSSYILANWYLRKFDEIVEKKIKPNFYGRYVDDIIFVFKEPIITEECFCCEEPDCINKYLSGKISKIGCFIANHLHEVIHIIPSKQSIRDKQTGKDKPDFDEEKYILKLNPRKFNINEKISLIVQKEKVYLYYFNHDDPISVLDKLKRDIDIASSEFRFFNDCYPTTFDDKVFELQYNGSSRKIITLKDYKINSFGLSVFLSKKIYNTRYYEIDDKSDLKKIITFFKGRNILDYSNHWEKLLTYLVLINKSQIIVKFLEEAVCEIKKIKPKTDNDPNNIEEINDVSNNLYNKLYWSFILSISLNPQIITKTMKLKLIGPNDFTPDIDKDIKNIRITNMLRQNLITIPLVNFTNHYFENHKFSLIAKKWDSLNFLIKKHEFNQKLIDYSPRQVCNYEVSLFKLIRDLHNKGQNTQSFHEYIKSLKILNIVKHFDVVQEHSGETTKLTCIDANSTHKQKIKLKIAVSNFYVNIENVNKRLKGDANITVSRFQKITKCIDVAEREKADIVVFPEYAVPVEFLDLLAKYAAHKQIAVIFGMEHIVADEVAYNYCITILPLKDEKYRDAVIIPRLKNHYAPSEVELIEGLGLLVPQFPPNKKQYHIFNFKGASFSLFYCLELANITHRSLLKSKVDFVVCSEWNKDVNYFSNIVESASRDLHCYFVQCNTRQFGDSRITAPAETVKKDLMKVKGGDSDVVLIGELDIEGIRDFQIKEHILQMKDNRFKLTPPDFDRDEVRKRIKESQKTKSVN